ncbi:MAG TPA: hypothetical protein VKY85_20290 [Candidatus Angelobacter sp.]|nr:hypothetical protein [Candidatus Angelobacter sp.]
MVQIEYYVAEITRFLPNPSVQHFRFSKPEEFDKPLKWIQIEELVIDICAVNDSRNIDYGNMILFANETRVFMRLLEQQDFVARDPALDGPTSDSVSFKDEKGSTFTLPLVETISKAQALRALQTWLFTFSKTSELIWQ